MLIFFQLWRSLRNQNGMEITLATPQGGAVSMSPCTAEALNKDEGLRTEIWNDSLLMNKHNSMRCSFAVHSNGMQ